MTHNAEIQNDLDLLNSSLAGEFFGIAAYQAALDSGLLEDGVAGVAKQFQSDHVGHAEKIRGLIENMGGTPVEPMSAGDYAKDYPPLTSQDDILRYAVTLEKSAASGHLSTVAKFKDRQLSEIAASISGDESMHWSVLLGAIGENPVPVTFIPLPQAA